MSSKYFSDYELQCHGNDCDGGAYKMNPVLLQKLDWIREACGGPLKLSCAYRCPSHNYEVGGVPSSQHLLGNAADVLVPDFLTIEQLAWYAEQAGMDGIGIYYNSGFVHMDVRDNGYSPGYYRWSDQD